ncbi:MAG: MBL fold metallo-hydrolase [Saprospiraceae bacterium]|nr:MBL fold metallo-hydrolase [Candidatus Defluviibacterium haderslevense]
MIMCSCATCLSKDLKDKRLRTSIHIQESNVSLVIDIGPDFRQQMLTHHIPDISAILLTHNHVDHTAGIDDIRPYNGIQNGTIPFFGEQYVLEDLKNRFHYIFSEHRYHGLPQVDLKTIEPNKTFLINDLPILPLRVMHGHLPILAYKIKNLVYITDASLIDEQVIDSMRGVECLVINALRIAKHPTHFNLKDCLDMIQLIQPRKAYIIHLSHQMGTHAAISAQLPEHVAIAFDGLTLEI